METTHERPIDQRVALDRLGGDAGIFLDFVGSVLEETPRMLAEIREALEKGRSEDAHCTAHGLKGMFATLEARPAAAAAQEVEQLTQAGQTNEATIATDRLAFEVDRLARAVSSLNLSDGSPDSKSSRCIA